MESNNIFWNKSLQASGVVRFFINGKQCTFADSEDWQLELSVSNQTAWHLELTSNRLNYVHRSCFGPGSRDEVGFLALRNDVIVTADGAGDDKDDETGEEDEEEGPGQHGHVRVDSVQPDLACPEHATADRPQ